MTIVQILPWVLLLSIVAFAAWWIFRPSARSRKTDFRVITASAVLVLMTGGFIFWQSGFRSAGTLDREEFDQRSELLVAFQEALQPAIDYVLWEDFRISTTTSLLLSTEELEELRGLLRSQMASRFGEAPQTASAVPEVSNPGESGSQITPDLSNPVISGPPPRQTKRNHRCMKGTLGGVDKCVPSQNKTCIYTPRYQNIEPLCEDL